MYVQHQSTITKVCQTQRWTVATTVQVVAALATVARGRCHHLLARAVTWISRSSPRQLPHHHPIMARIPATWVT